MKEVYDNYDFLRRLTEKRFSDAVLADEAHAYAFEGLAQNDWRRARAFEGRSSFRSYLGVVWCRLLEDFSIKKYGRVTPPKWIRNLGGIWQEMFRLLCCRWFSVAEAAESIMAGGNYTCSRKEIERAADEILANLPNCGKKAGPVSSGDEQPETDPPAGEDETNPAPEEIVLRKERRIALQALANVFFKKAAATSENDTDINRVNTLIAEIRKHLPLTAEDQLILTAHFVDGWSITDIGKRLGRNQNQIHGRFRRLMTKIRQTLPAILDSYL